MAMHILSMNLRSKSLHTAREVLASFMTDAIHPAHKYSKLLRKARPGSFQGSAKYVQTMRLPEDIVVNKDLVPDSYPLRDEDVTALCNFFDKSKKLVVLAGESIECDTGFEPMTHQKFMSSIHARQRYWAYSYRMWRKFKEVKPGPAHTALASLEKANRISLIITESIWGLHHRVGCNACDILGTVHIVTCVNCGLCFPRDVFEDNMNALNREWEKAAEKPDLIVSENSFWDEDLQFLRLPACSKCNGVLKPDAILVDDPIPEDRYHMALEAAKGCESFLILGTLEHPFAKELTKAAEEADATIAIVYIDETSCDDIADLKIHAYVEEILPRVLEKLGVSDIED